eukprot:1862074-Alexandrium_andersonii.AAC.1
MVLRAGHVDGHQALVEVDGLEGVRLQRGELPLQPPPSRSGSLCKSVGRLQEHEHLTRAQARLLGQ